MYAPPPHSGHRFRTASMQMEPREVKRKEICTGPVYGMLQCYAPRETIVVADRCERDGRRMTQAKIKESEHGIAPRSVQQEVRRDGPQSWTDEARRD